MALYLGSEKVGVVYAKTTEIPVPTGNYKAGTVVADENGVIVFPELNFTPKMITVWNVQQIDLKAEAEANGEDWDESYIRYMHTGTMLMAVYQDDTWITQGMTGNSGSLYISNASILVGSCVSVANNRYYYRIAKEPDDSICANETFNYAIYG